MIPVERIRNGNPANLYLMDRPDLHSAFTKINLWKQTQFRKIVYIDADVVAYRAPDELFDISHPFSAAPDIGWPDLFNTGVMVLTPDIGEYYALLAMAERGISFDGADQGLLNMHFKNNYNRLSFAYNVTPSAHYQYIPAYRHFQSSINMVHFIGADKPWFQGREAQTGSGPFNEMAGRWWAVYDRHYRREVSYDSGALTVMFMIILNFERLPVQYLRSQYQLRIRPLLHWQHHLMQPNKINNPSRYRRLCSTSCRANTNPRCLTLSQLASRLNKDRATTVSTINPISSITTMSLCSYTSTNPIIPTMSSLATGKRMMSSLIMTTSPITSSLSILMISLIMRSITTRTTSLLKPHMSHILRLD